MIKKISIFIELSSNSLSYLLRSNSFKLIRPPIFSRLSRSHRDKIIIYYLGKIVVQRARK